MSAIVSDNDREERERELNNKKRESYYMLLSLVVRMREHAHYMPTCMNFLSRFQLIKFFHDHGL